MLTALDREALTNACRRARGMKTPYAPWIELRDLSKEMQEIVGKYVVMGLNNKGGNDLTDSEAYMIILHDFGIKCPHVWKPLIVTHVDGSTSAPDNWNECVHCKCWQTRLPRQQLTYNQAP